MNNIKPRILQINSADKGGGAQQIAWDLHEGLTNDSFENKMLVSEKKSQSNSIFMLKESRLLTYLNLLFGTEFMLFRNTFEKIRKVINLDKIDLIHCHNLHGYYFNLRYFPKLCDLKPVVWTFHDMWPILGHAAHSLDCKRCESGKKCDEHMYLYPKLYTWNSSHWLYEIKKKILLSANFVIVVPSVWLKHKVENSFLKDKKIHLIRNGVDVDLYKPENKLKLRNELLLPKDKDILLFVASGGLNNTWKGVEVIKKLIDENKNQDDKIFIIIGGDENKLVENVRYVSFVKNKSILSKYYAAADVFLMPSLIENLPLVSLEAMACGTPVVAFNVGGVGEEIDHKIDGYLAKQGNYSDYIKGVDWMLENKSRLKEFRKIVRQKVVKYFSKSLMVKEYERLYCDILEKK